MNQLSKTRIIYIIFLIFFASLLGKDLFGQGQTKNLNAQLYAKNGDFAFNQGDYTYAITCYNYSYTKTDSVDIKAYSAYKLGECKSLLCQYRDALKWYEVAITLGYSDSIISPKQKATYEAINEEAIIKYGYSDSIYDAKYKEALIEFGYSDSIMSPKQKAIYEAKFEAAIIRDGYSDSIISPKQKAAYIANLAHSTLQRENARAVEKEQKERKEAEREAKLGLYVGFSYSFGLMGDVPYNKYNFSPELRIHPNIGLNWNFGWLKNSNDLFIFHSPGSSLLLWSKYGDGAQVNEGGALVLLILTVIPDGVTGHFAVNNNLVLSPYANFLGVDWVRDWYWPKSLTLYNMSYGLKTSYKIRDNFALSFIMETRKTEYYSWNYNLGVGFDIHLD